MNYLVSGISWLTEIWNALPIWAYIAVGGVVFVIIIAVIIIAIARGKRVIFKSKSELSPVVYVSQEVEKATIRTNTVADVANAADLSLSGAERTIKSARASAKKSNSDKAVADVANAADLSAKENNAKKTSTSDKQKSSTKAAIGTNRGTGSGAVDIAKKQVIAKSIKSASSSADTKASDTMATMPTKRVIPLPVKKK